MNTPVTSKIEIIERASSLFRLNGYNKTSIGHIAKECGIFKSNIYHYFGNKEELLIAAIKHNQQLMKNNVLTVLKNVELGRKERLSKYLDLMEVVSLNDEAGCFFGNLTNELSYQNDLIRKELNSLFEFWESELTSFFQENNNEIRAIELAEEVTSGVEGAIMLSHVTRNRKYYANFKKRIMNQV